MSTRTISPRSSTRTASASAPASIAPSRSYADSASAQQPVPHSTSTTTPPTSKRWSQASAKPKRCSPMSPAEVILAHHRRPHHRGTLDAPDGVATRHNPLCGETLTVAVTLDAGRLHEVVFDGESCSVGRASASVMTDLVVGRTPDEIPPLIARVQALVTGDP